MYYSIPSIDVSDHEILSASVDGHIRCYDIRMGQMHEDRMTEAVTCVRFSNDNNCLLVATLDSTIRFVNYTYILTCTKLL